MIHMRGSSVMVPGGYQACFSLKDPGDPIKIDELDLGHRGGEHKGVTKGNGPPRPTKLAIGRINLPPTVPTMPRAGSRPDPGGPAVGSSAVRAHSHGQSGVKRSGRPVSKPGLGPELAAHDPTGHIAYMHVPGAVGAAPA